MFWFMCDGSDKFVQSKEMVSSCRSVRATQVSIQTCCMSNACTEELYVVKVWSLNVCVHMRGGGSALFGCNGGPWRQVGLQQCGGQAGTVSHFGYVHIRSRSMAPPNECHFLRSNTQTWKQGAAED